MDGLGGLHERSRAPRHQPRAIASEIVEAILLLKQQWPRWGAPKLLARLKKQLSPHRTPSESTVSEILKRHGLSFTQRTKRRKATPSAQPFGQLKGPNDVWCIDFKGWFNTGNGQKCNPLTLSDAYSRYLLRCQGLGERTGSLLVKPILMSAFREYGLPMAIRSDNGPPFASTGLAGLTPLNVWWIRLGIGLQRIEPGNPQQNGRHERLHRTLKEYVCNPVAWTLASQQRKMEYFRQEYNEQRPHEALKQKTPSECYESSTREYPEKVPALREYPQDWLVRKIWSHGQMKWKGQNIHISRALGELPIGLQPIGDGLWAIWFEQFELGVFDERKLKVKGHRKWMPHGEA